MVTDGGKNKKAGGIKNDATFRPQVKCNINFISLDKKVKEAIHVDSSINWVLCADDLNYQTLVQDVSSYLHHALDTVKFIYDHF